MKPSPAYFKGIHFSNSNPSQPAIYRTKYDEADLQIATDPSPSYDPKSHSLCSSKGPKESIHCSSSKESGISSNAPQEGSFQGLQMAQATLTKLCSYRASSSLPSDLRKIKAFSMIFPSILQ